MPEPTDSLVQRLDRLGGTHYGKHPHSYFSHTSGRVSLAAASAFYTEAVALAREARAALTELDRDQRQT